MLALATALVLARCCGAAAADVYVSPSGSDGSGDGSAAKPYATLGKGQTAARSAGSPVTIRVGAGDYWQKEPLALTAADSGASWVGAGAGATVVRGGAAVIGWEQHALPHLPSGAGPVWRTKNPFAEPFFQLVEGRAPATVARHPNKGAGWLFNWTSTKVTGRSGSDLQHLPSFSGNQMPYINPVSPPVLNANRVWTYC